MEGFFYLSSSFDAVELRELLLKRYHTLDFINEMDLTEFLEFCELAIKKEKEERLFRSHCAMLPMLKKELWDFEAFKRYVEGNQVDLRPAEEIIAEIEEIHRKAGGEIGTGDI